MSSLVANDDAPVTYQHIVQPRIDPNPNLNPNFKLATMDDAKPMFSNKKKRKTSIEGNNITEVVDNIILQEPNVALVRKAFKKMVGFIDEKNEITFDL